MTITITDNHTRYGAETITFRCGLLVKRSRAYACIYEYTNSRKEKTVSLRSGLFREQSEYLTLLLAVKDAEANVKSVEGGDPSLVSRAWEKYLDSKQKKMFQDDGGGCVQSQ